MLTRLGREISDRRGKLHADEWKRMKDTNTVPAWEEEPKPDEVLVQTSTGLFKFQAARAQKKVPQATLTRTQSDGSVAPSAGGSGRHHAPSAGGSGRHHASSLSLDGLDDDDTNTRGAVLVEVEAEEVCTAAPLMAVSPRHTPQKPVYTYGQAEARLLCETSSALKTSEKNRRRISRQTSIEEDAKLIRKTIEEVERGSSRHLKEEEESNSERDHQVIERESPLNTIFSIQKSSKQNNVKELLKDKTSTDDLREDSKRKDADKNNGKKKTKCRARLEREQSKPSESDTDPEVDTVTVEIPRRRKRPRRASEKPRTPPTSLHSDSEGEVFVLKLKAPEQRDISPEVIVKTTRKIFSPVVRCGESVPRAVIPVNVEDLVDVRPQTQHRHDVIKREVNTDTSRENNSRIKGSGDLQDEEEQRKRSRPPLPLSPSSQRKPQSPLPLSPSSQRKPQSKETAPSIRIMIQRYNKKIHEDGHTSGENSGASSPAWRSPTAERRRPPDMPVGVNIRNNPFLEREVQKSVSACQLSRRDQTSAEKRLTPTPSTSLEGVLKSHSANTLHPDKRPHTPELEEKLEDSQETIVGTGTTASIDTIVPDLTKNLPKLTSTTTVQSLPVMRQFSETVIPTYSRLISESPSVNPSIYGRSLSTVDAPVFPVDPKATARISERAARIKAARDRFLLSSGSMRRREGTSSASDLRRTADRSSTISCDSDVAESHSSSSQTQDSNLERSASTGMVNVDREAWQREDVAKVALDRASAWRGWQRSSDAVLRMRARSRDSVDRAC
ncbi:Uncharacterized protein OBRU01_11273, partial [Operophtera brumata]